MNPIGLFIPAHKIALYFYHLDTNVAATMLGPALSLSL